MTVTDREFLELAAKAAGVEIVGISDDGMAERADGGWWNPLEDDGDALRLAVQLGMRVYVYPAGGDDVTVVANDELRAKGDAHISEPHGSDRFSATRRAIVRAAAEIGKSMEKTQ